MANTSIGTKKKTDDESTTTYALGSGYSKSGRKLPTTAEEAIAAGRYLDDDGYWRTSSGYKLRTGTSQGGGYTSYDGVGGGYGGKNSASANSITDPIETDDGSSSVRDIYNYVNGIGEVGDYPTGSFTDPYDLTSVIDQLTNMSYEDWTQGDQYKALADRYGLQADSAARDVLGQVMSRTGGLASSYAQTVANQQYNDYMAQLEQVAREMYQSDRSELEDQYKYMSDYNDTAYDRYRDELSDRQAAYDAAYERALAAAKAANTTTTGTKTKTKTKAAADDDDETTTGTKKTGTAKTTTDMVLETIINGISNAANKLKSGQTGNSQTGSATSDPTIKNQHAMNSDGEPAWIYVAGLGRMRTDELEDLIESGDVVENYDKKTNTLSYYQNPNK